MQLSDKATRRNFFNSLGVLASAAMGVLWYRLTARHENINNKSLPIRITGEISEGVTLYDNVFLVRNGDHVKAFSATCTHAGCRITQVEGGTLQCPCHGSAFDAKTGKPTRGPALKPLKQLECRFEKETGEWHIRRE